MRDESFVTDSRKAARDREQALRKQPLKQSWPSLIMIPVLVGVLHVCAFSLLFKLFLGESFGLSGGRPAPWPGAIALVFLASFWSNRFIGRLRIGMAMAQVITSGCWLATYLAWILLEPGYRDTDVWSHPGQFVQSEAFLVLPMLISMILWWVGMTYAAEIANISAEEIRTVVQRDWLVLFGSILLAAMAGGSGGDDALEIARIVVPVQLIVSLALVAGAEVESTRRLAIRRGGQPPGWGRWVRLVGGLAAGVLLLTLLVLAVLSPEALSAIVGGMATAARGVGWVLAYVLLAVVWTIFQIVFHISRLLEYIFGDIFGPISQPSIIAPEPINFDSMSRPEGATQQWEYAVLLRWFALFVAIAVVAIIFFRVTRKSVTEDNEDAVDEQRVSVFSADLAKQQLRDFFRRRHREGRPVKLDLDRQPASIRETMVYLETLAARQGVARKPEETSEDFAARLRAVWSGVAAPLIDFPRRYERIRYGEHEDSANSPDYERVAQDWAQIWKARKDAPPPRVDEPKA